MQVHRATDELERSGARVAVIGNGQPRFIEDFRRTTQFDGDLYTDPSREAYRACGFAHGVRTTFNVKSATQMVRSLRAGHRQGLTRGDPWQQGGALVVDTQGDLLTVQRSRHAGDHASIGALIAAIEQAEG